MQEIVMMISGFLVIVLKQFQVKVLQKFYRLHIKFKVRHAKKSIKFWLSLASFID